MQQNRRLKRAPPSACYREKTENNKHKKATRARIAFFIYNGPNGKREFNLYSPIILELKIGIGVNFISLTNFSNKIQTTSK